jgi:hypothetical protein
VIPVVVGSSPIGHPTQQNSKPAHQVGLFVFQAGSCMLFTISDWLFSMRERCDMPNEKTKQDAQNDGSPKFGRLLIVLFLAVIFVGVLTWIMETYFPDFPNFG